MKSVFILSYLLAASSFSFAQTGNVGVGTTAPDPFGVGSSRRRSILAGFACASKY